MELNIPFIAFKTYSVALGVFELTLLYIIGCLVFLLTIYYIGYRNVLKEVEKARTIKDLKELKEYAKVNEISLPLSIGVTLIWPLIIIMVVLYLLFNQYE